MTPHTRWRVQAGWCRWTRLPTKNSFLAVLSTKSLGDMRSKQRFEKQASAWGVARENWVGANQTHGTTVQWIGPHRKHHLWTRTDGLATAQPRMALRIFVADCAPVFLFDSKRNRIALVHAGWRGVNKGILKRAIRLLTKMGTDPAHLWMGIGPHIQACCYEVGQEVARHFSRTPGALRQSLRGTLTLNMARCLLTQAQQAGIKAVRVVVAPHCTAHDKRFFSFRRQGTSRRMAAIALLRNGEQ